jgi:uncharacterized membrane protein YgaE (UPF0421/DUF939 family)
MKSLTFSWEYRHRLRRLLRLLKRFLRLERRLNLEESYQLLQLSETIMDHGRMLQSYLQSPMDYVIVEIQELALRLRETPEAIEDALLLLRGLGRAYSYDGHGGWKLRLEGTVRSDSDGKGNAASA